MITISNKILSAFLLFSVFILLPISAFADYKIILKNGREFVVDDYKDIGSKIRFYREGGEIELDKGLIKDIKKTKAIKKPAEEPPAVETPVEKPAEEKGAQPQKQDIDGKMKELAAKKAQLKAEGDKLSSDKKKLEEDIKKEGRVLNIRKEREYKQRVAELEEKIKKLNEEIKKADQEEALLLKQSSGQK